MSELCIVYRSIPVFLNVIPSRRAGVSRRTFEGDSGILSARRGGGGQHVSGCGCTTPRGGLSCVCHEGASGRRNGMGLKLVRKNVKEEKKVPTASAPSEPGIKRAGKNPARRARQNLYTNLPFEVLSRSLVINPTDQFHIELNPRSHLKR